MNTIPCLTVSQLLSKQKISVGTIVVTFRKAMLLVDINNNKDCWTFFVNNELMYTSVGLYDNEILLKI